MGNNEIEIIEMLKKQIYIENPPVIDEIQFDLLVDKLIENDEKELMFRLCGSYRGYNVNKVVDYYIKEKDSYYLEELVYFIDGKLDQEYLTRKMLETKDKNFISDTLEQCGNAIQYCMDEKLLEELLDYLKR